LDNKYLLNFNYFKKKKKKIFLIYRIYPNKNKINCSIKRL